MDDKRLHEFVWYHLYGDGDCNGQVLREYAREHGLSMTDCFDLAYFYSITYCCASAVVLLNGRDKIVADCRAVADANKGKLVFQSDRKYVRMRDTFYNCLVSWRDRLRGHDFSEYIVNGELSLKAALEEVQGWYFFSRFSAYLFVETFCDIHGIGATQERGMRYEGDSMTFAGGLFYVYGLDDEARYVQKRHKLPIDTETFECLIAELQTEVRLAGGDDNFSKLETSLCAYEKFFKGSRYNGYYADRQLAELVKMRGDYPKQCDELFKARAAAIPSQYRGEVNGWDGIRTQLKKSYAETGKIIGYGEKYGENQQVI